VVLALLARVAPAMVAEQLTKLAAREAVNPVMPVPAVVLVGQVLVLVRLVALTVTLVARTVPASLGQSASMVLVAIHVVANAAQRGRIAALAVEEEEDALESYAVEPIVRSVKLLRLVVVTAKNAVVTAGSTNYATLVSTATSTRSCALQTQREHAVRLTKSVAMAPEVTFASVGLVRTALVAPERKNFLEYLF